MMKVNLKPIKVKDFLIKDIGTISWPSENKLIWCHNSALYQDKIQMDKNTRKKQESKCLKILSYEADWKSRNSHTLLIETGINSVLM